MLFFVHFRSLTVQQILAALENDDDDVDAIFIEPPEAAVVSDEDSADEDASGLVDNLSGRQLRSHAEVVYHNEHLHSDDGSGDDTSSTGKFEVVF